MPASSISTERVIHAPIDRVWDIITDLDYAHEVMDAIVKIERVEGEGYEVGVRWRETRRMWGREETEEMWVAVVEEPRTTEVRAESRGTQYVTVFTLEEVEDGTRIVIDFSADTPDPGLAQRIGWAVFGRAGMKATRKALEKDLDDIARAVET